MLLLLKDIESTLIVKVFKATIKIINCAGRQEHCIFVTF